MFGLASFLLNFPWRLAMKVAHADSPGHALVSAGNVSHRSLAFQKLRLSVKLIFSGCGKVMLVELFWSALSEANLCTDT